MVNTGVSWLKPRLIWGNQTIFNEKSKVFIKHWSIKYFFSLIGSNETGRYFFKHCLLPALWAGTTVTFFLSNGKGTLSMHWLKISFQDLKINLTEIFIMGILILSWRGPLFGSKFCIILSISLLKKLRLSNSFRLCNEGWKVVHYCYLSKNIVSQRKE